MKQNVKPIMYIGFALVAVLLAVFVASSLFFPNYLTTLLNITLSNATLGRLASLSLGIAKEVEGVWLILFSLLVELTQIFLYYALFVKSFSKVESFNWLQAYFSKAKKAIKKYQPFLHKYGMVGLVLFVLTPLAMTGPVVGSFAGFLIGFSHLKTLSTITIATLMATIVWYFLLRYFEQSLVVYSTLLMQGFYVVLLGLGVWFLVKRFMIKS